MCCVLTDISLFSPSWPWQGEAKAAELPPWEGPAQMLPEGKQREGVESAITKGTGTCLPGHISLLNHSRDGLRSQVVAFLAL